MWLLEAARGSAFPVPPLLRLVSHHGQELLHLSQTFPHRILKPFIPKGKINCFLADSDSLFQRLIYNYSGNKAV